MYIVPLPFEEAFEVWLSRYQVGERSETSVHYIRPRSEETYREYAWALGQFFSGTPLNKIHDGMLRKYQDLRAVNGSGLWFKKCGQNRLTKEVKMLIRMMQAAGVWTTELENSFACLKIQDPDIPRVPEPEQREKLFQVMQSRDEWLWIYYWAVLARRTTASTYEMRMARRQSIDLRHGTFHVAPEASKAAGRNRTIPLCDDAMEAAGWLLCRAKRLGSTDPEHFVFPFGVGSKHAIRSDSADVRLCHEKPGQSDQEACWNAPLQARRYAALGYNRACGESH